MVEKQDKKGIFVCDLYHPRINKVPRRLSSIMLPLRADKIASAWWRKVKILGMAAELMKTNHD